MDRNDEIKKLRDAIFRLEDGEDISLEEARKYTTSKGITRTVWTARATTSTQAVRFRSQVVRDRKRRPERQSGKLHHFFARQSRRLITQTDQRRNNGGASRARQGRTDNDLFLSGSRLA